MAVSKAVGVAFAVFLVAAVSGAPGRLSAEEDAGDFVQSLANEATAALADESLSAADRERALGRLFDKSFDLRTISRFALGRYWRTATPAERREYQAVFRDFIVKTSSKRFSSFTGEQLEVTGSRREGKMDVVVRSRILRPKGPPIRVMWRLRRSSEDYRVIDVIVEGVSMLITQRDEFSSVIRNSGGKVEGLIAILRKKVRALE